MPDEAKKPADEILSPKTVKVTYGGFEYEIQNLSISKIIRLSRIIGTRFGKIYDIFLEDIPNGEKLEKILNQLDDQEIIEIIAIALCIEPATAEAGFKAIDAIRVIRAVFEQEDVGKIFFEIRQIKMTMEKK